MPLTIKENLLLTLRCAVSDGRATDAEEKQFVVYINSLENRSTLYGAYEPVNELVQANADSLIPGHVSEMYGTMLTRALPGLLTDAQRFRGLVLILCEPNDELRNKMCGAVEQAFGDIEDHIDANAAPTPELINDIVDRALLAAAQARGS